MILDAAYFRKQPTIFHIDDKECKRFWPYDSGHAYALIDQFGSLSVLVVSPDFCESRSCAVLYSRDSQITLVDSESSPSRPGWDDIFIGIAEKISERSTCPRASVGCVITKDNRVLSMGYNGSVSGAKHCSDSGCLIKDGSCIRTIHAEENAILNASKNAVSVAGATAYVTHSPCINCCKRLVQAGVAHVKFKTPYRLEQSVEFVESNGIDLSFQWLDKQ